jgi:hypothetical protein
MPGLVSTAGWPSISPRWTPNELRELVTEAWLVTAPRRVTRQFER